MAYNAGVTKYQKQKWMKELSDKITAGSLKMSIHNVTTTWDANTDPTTPQTYSTTGELSSTGTGYVAGGYVLDEPVLAASGTGYQLQFSNVGGAAGTITTGAGTIPTGTYCGVVYDTSDGNKVLYILNLTVTQASSGGAMVFTVPANAVSLT